MLADTTSDASLSAGAARIPLEHAKALVARFAEVTTSRDASVFAQGFTEDCAVRFNSVELSGRDALQRFMASLFAPIPASFICRKTLRAISGDVLGVEWVSHWTDPETGKAMKSRGSEFWVMRDDRIARWDAVTAMWADET
ncbi:MAG TPA: nuclear transport factor 2 family protein [Noviherbaspirillum sp.]|uniref:nuclear transport factor 2 family protein n=1 Tax=Noviherbaspirillum sp. TaxID=1926288 RepID=UPI002D2CCB52|nr:nuclear transport factor 2 family protein [Noviherbaspirillum sp.]HYD95210.1 nuclear transport factor 2 family protein [Noviherbaspirillum sp.]